MIRRRLVAVSVGLVLACTLGEVTLRVVLFGGVSSGWKLRDPARYFDYQSEEDFFKHAILWGRAQSTLSSERYHPVMGWVSSALDATSLEHACEPETRGRRRVLLYGDSYAHCVSDPGTRFEDAFERSSLAATHQLLNHGVPGHGLDQITLMFESTVDRHVDGDPLVLIGIFIDDDLDRCAFSMREFPKPRFEIDGGELRLTGVPVPTLESYLADHPAGCWSYLARLLLPHAARGGSSDRARLERKKARIATALVARIARGLRERDLRGVFILFEGEERTVADEPVLDWRMKIVRQAIEDHGFTSVPTRDVLRRRAAAQDRDPADYFGHGGVRSNHFNAEGNEVALAALLDAINAMETGRASDLDTAGNR